MNEEEGMKQKKLEELRKQYLERTEAEEKQLQAEQELQAIVRKLLDDGARTRLNNVKLVNRELYLRTTQAIIYLYQAGQLKERIDEEQLKQLLGKLTGKKDIRIKRK